MPKPGLGAVLWVAFVLVLADKALATTRYVHAASAVAASADCSVAANPCRTLHYAVSQSFSGDVILIRDAIELGGTVFISTPSLTISSWDVRAVLRPNGTFSALSITASGCVVSALDVVVPGAVPASTVFGGAISFANVGSGTARDVHVTSPGQECVREGTGIHISSSTNVQVLDCSFVGLSVCSQGAGVFVGASTGIVIRNCLFRDMFITETTGLGGAAFFAIDSTVDVFDTLFRGGLADLRNGGAVYLASSPPPAPSLSFTSFTNCTFASNEALDGGAVFQLYSDATYTSSRFIGNRAASGGGAVLVYEGAASLINTDCVGNIAQDGGCLLIQNGYRLAVDGGQFSENAAQVAAVFELRATRISLPANRHIRGAVFHDNFASESASIIKVGDSLLDASDCLMQNNLCLSGGSLLVSGTSIMNIDNITMLNNRGELGALTQVASSLVMLTNSRFVSNTVTSTGGAIFVSQAASLGMSDVLFSDNTAESTGGSLYAFTTGAVNITRALFSAGLSNYGGGCAFVDFQTSFVVQNSSFVACRTLTGEGGGLLVRQAVKARLTRVLFDSNSAALGGGLYVTGTANVLAQELEFTHNEASSEGGGIFLDFQTVSHFANTSVLSNYAPQGGGLSVFGLCQVSFVDSVFALHTQEAAASVESSSVGSAIFCSVTARVHLTRCLVRNNTVSSIGGAVMTSSCMFNISESQFVNNSAGVFGGALYVDASSQVSNSTFLANSAKWGGAMFMLFDDLITSPHLNVLSSHFEGNRAAGAGGAVYWEAIRPASLPSCQSCTFANNVASGYGSDEATSASVIEIIVTNSTDPSRPDSPPLSIDASRPFEVHVVVRDYFGAIYRFSDSSAVRTLTAEVTAESIPVGEQNATVIGSALVTVVDGFADFTGLFLRGSATNRNYNLVIRTTPSSTETRWSMFLEPCEAGFAQIPHPVFLFECIECASGTYDLGRTSFCLPCRDGAICEGLTRIFALQDFWWDPTSSLIRPDYYQCIPGRCCPVSEPGNRCQRTKPCADGWNQTSVLCSKCNDGSYEWNNKCLPCSDSNKWRFALVFVVAIALVGVLFSLGSKVGAEIRIFVFFSQAIVMVIGPVHRTMPFFGISHGHLDILSVDDRCFVRLTPLEKLVALYTIPLLLFVLLSLFSSVYIVIRLVQRERLKKVAMGEHVPWISLARVFNAFINLLGICTVPLLHTSFQLLICRKVNTNYVLNYAPDVLCYEGVHMKWMLVAVAVSVFYVFILPFALFIYRRRATMRLIKQRFWQRDIIASHQMYKPKLFWWECVLLVRDILLVLNYVLWFSEPRRRVVAVMMIVFLSLYAHAFGMPFFDERDNAVELVTLFTISYTAFLVTYPYRFQLANEVRDKWLRDLMLFSGFSISGGFVAFRILHDFIAPFVSPIQVIQAGAYDVHHNHRL